MISPNYDSHSTQGCNLALSKLKRLSPSPKFFFEIMEKEGWKGEGERSCQLRRIGSTDRPLPCAFNALY